MSCECPRCGRQHRSLGFSNPPEAISSGMKHDPLEVRILSDRLVISIGVETLMIASTQGSPWTSGLMVKITDREAFVNAIVRALKNELSDAGDTLVHHAFDKAAEAAMEDGEGIEVEPEPTF